MIRRIHYFFVALLPISIVLLQLAFVPSSFAVEPDEILKDPALEQRARTLSAELRCLVCQNQSIDDSNAPLARDLRLLVRERLTAGDSDKELLDFIVARYGEFVLLRPPFGWHTILLWLAPLMLLAGAIALARSVSSRNRHAMVAAQLRDLTPDEQARLAKLMDANPGDPG